MQAKSITIALFAVLFVGCSHHKVREKPFQAVQPNMFWQDQSDRRAFLSGFSGKLKLTYDGKSQSVSGKGRIVGKFPNLFRLELRDPIGRLHYVLTSKGSDLAAYYPRNRQALKDSSSGRLYFRRVLGSPFAFPDLAAFFVGVLPDRWDRKKFSSWAWDPEKGAYRGILEQDSEKLTVWVDSEFVGISAIQWETPAETIDAEYTGFEPCCEGGDKVKNLFRLASEVRVRIPSQQTAVEVSWSGLTRPSQEIPATAFELTPAPGDKVLELK